MRARTTGRTNGCQYLLTALALCVLPLPTLAETPVPITAVLDACTDPDDSLGQRLTLLADAGWRTADDSPLVRGLVAQSAALRFPNTFDAGSDDGIAPMKGVAESALPLAQPPGQVLGLAAVADSLTTDTFVETILARPDLDAIVDMRIGAGAKGASLTCNISLGTALSDERRADLLQRLGLPVTPPVANENGTRRIDTNITNAEGSRLRLSIIEILPNTTFPTKAAMAGIKTPLATFLTSSLGPFPIEVTP